MLRRRSVNGHVDMKSGQPLTERNNGLSLTTLLPGNSVILGECDGDVMSGRRQQGAEIHKLISYNSSAELSW